LLAKYGHNKHFGKTYYTGCSKVVLMTVKDFAELLNCSEKTIYSWVETKREGLPFYKLGNGRKSLVRFKREEIELWIQQWKVRDE